MKILITGASGLVGRHLTEVLLNSGYTVGHLGRGKGNDTRVRHFTWDPLQGTIDPEATLWADAIVNLAGAGIAEKRWTEARKKLIVESRVKSLRVLAETIRKQTRRPSVLISASGVNYYGTLTSDHVFTETDPPARDFLADCCRQWEAAADLFEEMDVRTVKLRIGAVLAKDGGALPKLAGPAKWGLGSPLGTGRQWMPWIHIDDLCAFIRTAIENEKTAGVYNAAASQAVTNREFVKTLGRVLKRPVFLPPVPGFVLRMLLGEMAGIVTEGSRVSNEKTLKSGFTFRYPELQRALGALLNSKIQ